MKLIDRYFCRNILISTGMVALVIGLLAALGRTLHEVKNLGDDGYNFFILISYVVLKTPADLYSVLPLIAIIGSLMAVGNMAAGRELIVLRSTGMSMARMAVSISFAGILLALLTAAVSEYIGPNGRITADHLKESARHGGAASTQTISGTTWLKQGNTVVRIGRIFSNNELKDITLYLLNDDKRLTATIHADRATQDTDGMVLKNPVQSVISKEQVTTPLEKQLHIDINLDSDVIKLARIDPDRQTVGMLWRYVQYLESNHIDSQDYRLAMWRKITAPFTMWLLTIFALPFAFGSLRSASAGQRLFYGGLAGIIFYLTNEILAPSSMVYGLPPWLAASLPTLLLAFITVVWIRRLN